MKEVLQYISSIVLFTFGFLCLKLYIDYITQILKSLTNKFEFIPITLLIGATLALISVIVFLKYISKYLKK